MRMNQWEGTHLSFPLIPPLPPAVPPIAPLPEAKILDHALDPDALLTFEHPFSICGSTSLLGSLKPQIGQETIGSDGSEYPSKL